MEIIGCGESSRRSCSTGASPNPIIYGVYELNCTLTGLYIV